MILKTIRFNSFSIISLKGKFDFNSIKDFQLIFDNELKSIPKFIALDMNNLEYIDSSGIGILIKCFNKIKAQNGYLIMFGMNSFLHNIFHNKKLTIFFDILSNKEFKIKIGHNKDLI